MIDTSCFLLFDCLGAIHLLKEILDALNVTGVLVPEVVHELITVDVNNLIQQLALEEVAVDPRYYQEIRTKYKLGPGEAAVLVCARTNSFTAILDDFHARKAAREVNVSLSGSLGLLGAGFVACPIATQHQLRDLLVQSRTCGFRLPTNLQSYIQRLSKR